MALVSWPGRSSLACSQLTADHRLSSPVVVL
jgi:hypothetical protein